jgi:hypothetical protein
MANLPDMDEKGLCESAINWLNRAVHIASDKVHYEAPRFIVDATKDNEGVINIKIAPRKCAVQVPPGEYKIRHISNDRFEIVDGPFQGAVVNLSGREANGG